MNRSNPERGGAIGRFLNLIIGLVVGVAVAMFVYGLATGRGFRVIRTQQRGETRVETPMGNLRVTERASLDPTSFGVPLYPGARRIEDSRKLAQVEFDAFDTHKDLSAATAEYVTDDTIDRVERFYRGKLTTASIDKARFGAIRFEFQKQGLKKVVLLREKLGRTHITLASVGEGAEN
jgi:hypothetical protein